MKQKYMIIDVALCHDCNNCFMGCKDEFVDNEWENTYPQPRHGHRWINILRRERGVYSRNDVAYLPMTCQHCENPRCVPESEGAIVRREDGVVLIDKEKSKGKRELLDACPYGGTYYNEEYDVPQKCTMCAHLLDDKTWTPGMPRCVHNCPTGAMEFLEAEPEEMEARLASGEVAYYHPEYNTKPHVLYKNLHKFTKNFVSAGVIVAGDCCEGAVATIKGAGHEETQTTNFFGEFKFDALDEGTYTITVDAQGKPYQTEVTIAGASLNLGFITPEGG